MYDRFIIHVITIRLKLVGGIGLQLCHNQTRNPELAGEESPK